jgi:hypothetical protein
LFSYSLAEDSEDREECDERDEREDRDDLEEREEREEQSLSESYVLLLLGILLYASQFIGASHREDMLIRHPSHHHRYKVDTISIMDLPNPNTNPMRHGCNDHAFIYNITPRNILPNEDIPFDSNGSITPAFIHNYGSSVLIVKRTGIYKITFCVSSDISNQLALYINNFQRWGTLYGINSGYQNFGQAIIELCEGDVISVRNITQTQIQLTTLNVDIYGTVNASLLIEAL